MSKSRFSKKGLSGITAGLAYIRPFSPKLAKQIAKSMFSEQEVADMFPNSNEKGRVSEDTAKALWAQYLAFDEAKDKLPGLVVEANEVFSDLTRRFETPVKVLLGFEAPKGTPSKLKESNTKGAAALSDCIQTIQKAIANTKVHSNLVKRAEMSQSEIIDAVKAYWLALSAIAAFKKKEECKRFTRVLKGVHGSDDVYEKFNEMYEKLRRVNRKVGEEKGANTALENIQFEMELAARSKGQRPQLQPLPPVSRAAGTGLGGAYTRKARRGKRSTRNKRRAF